MSDDLRSALKALADEMDATTYRTGMDMLTAPPPRRIREWAERIRELLGSHEEWEGETMAWLVHYGCGCDIPCTTKVAGTYCPKHDEDGPVVGHTELVARRLRPHTDRERPPGHYVCWCGKVVHGGPGKYGGRTLYETNGDLHECDYDAHTDTIGPPVQPEEGRLRAEAEASVRLDGTTMTAEPGEDEGA